MIIDKTKSAIIFKPTFWNIRKKLERLLGKLELDTQCCSNVEGEQEGTWRMKTQAFKLKTKLLWNIFSKTSKL